MTDLIKTIGAPRYERQKGSVLPYLVVSMLALVFSAHFVFNAYKTSNESTRLQNTTDAAAYSVSTVYAQNYNFVALSNRSLVANQISMAQLVTIVSWTRMVATLAETIDGIGQFIPFVNTITAGIEQTANGISQGVELVARGGTTLIGGYTRTISAIQQLSVPLVIAIAQEILDEVVEENDPDVDLSFARINVGVSGVAHITRNIHGQNNCLNQSARVRQGGRASDDDEETVTRCQQFRSVTLGSRDGFTSDRTYRFGPNFRIPLGPIPVEDVDVTLFSWISIERGGGTSLGDGTNSVNRSAPFTSWSAIDTISLHASSVYIDFGGFFPSIERSRHQEQAKLGVGHAFVGDSSTSEHHPIHEGSNYWSVNPRGSSCTDTDYANSRRSLNRGAFILLDVVGLNCGSLANDYGDPLQLGSTVGLTPFHNLSQAGYVEEQDRSFIYLRKDREDVALTSDETGASDDSDFQLDSNEGAQTEAFHAAAGTAVHFRRSNDDWMLSNARRLDGRIEFGNTYNPFWEARLHPITTEQRLLLEGLQEARP